jgi:hypothetical protein
MTVIGALSSFRELGHHTWIVRHPTPARRWVCLIGRDPNTLLTRRRGLSVGRHDRCQQRHHTLAHHCQICFGTCLKPMYVSRNKQLNPHVGSELRYIRVKSGQEIQRVKYRAFLITLMAING